MPSLAVEREARAAAALLFLGLAPASGQILGPEFRVNSYTTENQNESAVAADGAGTFVVVWQSYEQDGSDYGVFARRFDAAGDPLGAEFRVNSYTTDGQRYPAVSAHTSGAFVVVWESYTDQDGSLSGIFGQRYDSAGAPAGTEFRVNSHTTERQRLPAVAVDGAGNFVVVWESYPQDGSHYGIFGQRFDSAGDLLGGEFLVNTSTTNSQNDAVVAADSAGNFVVVWASASPSNLFGQRFDSAGNELGTEFQVNTYTTGLQLLPSVAAAGAGRFVVVWQSSEQDGSSIGVFGQRFDAAGNKSGSELRANSYTTDAQNAPAVAADGAGNFVVQWQSNGQDGSGWGVFGQRYDAAGASVGGEFRVNLVTASVQYGPALVADGAGNFVVVWTTFGQDGDLGSVFARQMTLAIFADGFEGGTGDTCAWSTRVGSTDDCP